MDAYDMYQLRKKNILPILPSVVEAENFSDHPRTLCCHVALLISCAQPLIICTAI